MHLVNNWPVGCLLFLLRITCVVVSNGTMSVYLMLARAQDAHGYILTSAHGGQRADVVDYIDYDMHYFIYLLRTIALKHRVIMQCLILE